MKYFLHDTNSFNDEKVSELFLKFGYEGIGLFYTILEKIGSQEKPIKTSILKKQLFVGKKLEKCWLFMEEIGLISSNNGDTFNERLLNYAEKYQIRKEKNREKIERHRRKNNDNQYYTDNVTGYETGMKPNGNYPKVKESKVKRNKDGTENIFLGNGESLRGIKIDKDKNLVYFKDGSSQPLGQGQQLRLKDSSYQPHYIHKGQIE